MRWRCAAFLLGALCLQPAVARADSFDTVSFGVHAGTLGYGINLERPLLFDLSARASLSTLTSTTQSIYDNNPWSSRFTENNVLVAIDFRPYGGRWRVSGGLLFGSDHVDKIAQSVNGNYVFNGNTYSAANSGAVTSTVSYARPAIYLGVGAGTGILKGLTIAFDAGVVVRNGSSTTSAGSGPLANNPQFRSDLATTTAQFRTHFIQPVASVGVSFRP
jgi:hypothetical protein